MILEYMDRAWGLLLGVLIIVTIPASGSPLPSSASTDAVTNSSITPSTGPSTNSSIAPSTGPSIGPSTNSSIGPSIGTRVRQNGEKKNGGSQSGGSQNGVQSNRMGQEHDALQQKNVHMVLQQLADANVVYLAETHDRASDHQAQLEIIQALHRLRPNLVIGMEMFQRPHQFALNGYLSGHLTETDLQHQSQYQKRWGYPWEFYAPILRFAKAQKLPVVALNVPTEITRKVARAGLDGLSVAERQWIPPKSAIVLGPESYRQEVRQIYAEMHHGKGNSAGFERFFLAQVLWDETMAEQIAKTLRQRPDSLMVVLVGQGHVLYGHGIPQRVDRRMNRNGANINVAKTSGANTIGIFQPPLKQRSVVLNPGKDLEAVSDPAIADYFWYSPAS